MRGLRDLIHVGQVVAAIADRRAERVEGGPDGQVGHEQPPQLLADLLVLEPLAGGLVQGFQLGAQLGVVAPFPQHEQQPVGDELDVALGAFRLEEPLQLVVAVALGGHRPELADDRHARSRTGPV